MVSLNEEKIIVYHSEFLLIVYVIFENRDMKKGVKSSKSFENCPDGCLLKDNISCEIFVS